MQKYEYLCVAMWGRQEKLTRRLNEYGQEGWEFVHVAGTMHYFKRPIRGAE